MSANEAMKLVESPKLQGSAKALTIKGYLQLYENDYKNKVEGEKTLKKAVNLGSAFALGYLLDHLEEEGKEIGAYEFILPHVENGGKMASLYAFHLFKDPDYAKDLDDTKRKLFVQRVRKNLENNKDDAFINYTLQTEKFYLHETNQEARFNFRNQALSTFTKFLNSKNDLVKYTARRELNSYQTSV